MQELLEACIFNFAFSFLWFAFPVSHLCEVILLQNVSDTLHEHYYIYVFACLTLLERVVQSLSSCGNAKAHKTYRICHVGFTKFLEHVLGVIWSNNVT